MRGSYWLMKNFMSILKGYPLREVASSVDLGLHEKKLNVIDIYQKLICSRCQHKEKSNCILHCRSKLPQEKLSV